MKKDFESRFMPNVKFKLYPINANEHERKRIFSLVKNMPNFPVLYFGYRTNFDGSIIYNGFENQEVMDCYAGNSIKEVSIYEAIPELIPDGMRYNKELDKLVPDVISASNEYCSGIKVEQEPVKSYVKKIKNHRDHNIGSSNYASMKIQPWDVWRAWNLNPWDADMVKRIARTKKIPGTSEIEARIEDYEKIKHNCDERISQLREELNAK